MRLSFLAGLINHRKFIATRPKGTLTTRPNPTRSWKITTRQGLKETNEGNVFLQVMNSRFCVQIRTILLKWKGWNGAWRVFCKLRKFVVKCDMSHLRVFFGPFITKTIANHRTWIWVKPLKNHQCQWSICKKNIQWWWSGGSKNTMYPGYWVQNLNKFVHPKYRVVFLTDPP